MGRFEHHIFICENLRDSSDERGSCAAKGSNQIRLAMKQELKSRGIRGTVRANQSGCLDACEFGPSMVIYPEGVWYGGVQLSDVPAIIDEHIIGGSPIERLIIKDPKFNQ